MREVTRVPKNLGPKRRGGEPPRSKQCLIGVVVVAFISGIGRLDDPWGDLVNYFRDVSVNEVKLGLLATGLGQFAMASPAIGPNQDPGGDNYQSMPARGPQGQCQAPSVRSG
jgi:hypothetical protein